MKKSIKNIKDLKGKDAGKGKSKISIDNFVKGIRQGDRVMLGRAITLIESKNPEHKKYAQEILEKCLPYSGNSIRIGITGIPGVGKSTFIEKIGLHAIGKGKKIAVMAIDPTSQISGGSILGDKTRMPFLAANENAFIRPTPSGETLGGVAKKTRETIILCEAAGYDTIIIETVGVGQSETAVHSMVDFFLLLLLPGAGDELQGMKRGIMEMADLIAINKADGDFLHEAKITAKEYENAIHLFPPKENGLPVKTLTCSAIAGEGIKEIWKSIMSFYKQTKTSGFFEKRRKEQAIYLFYESIKEKLTEEFFNDTKIKTHLSKIENDILNGEMSPFVGAEILLRMFFR